MNRAAALSPVASWVLVSVLAGLLMLSTVSLWIDEGQTLRFAQQPTLANWWQTLRANPYSEAHMPVGMLAAWLGARVFGTSEWGLRAPNLVWLVLAAVAMGLLGRYWRRPALLPLFLLQPFLWAYVNEARPYAMQICAGAWLLYLLALWMDGDEIRPAPAWVLTGVCLFGFGSSLLFGFALLGWAAALVVGRAMRPQPPPQTFPGSLPVRPWLPAIHRSALLPLGVSALVLGGLGVYFIGALQRGAGGARLWEVGWGNLAFAGYELLGAMGLGPPRNELRELGRLPRELLGTLVQPRYLVGLGGLCLAWLLILVLLWRQRRDRVLIAILAWLGSTAVSLLAASWVVHFPFWGRHLAPLLAGVVALAALVVFPPAGQRWLLSQRIAALLLVLCLAISSATVRWSDAHQKDDYRSAVALARRALAQGLSIWWTGDAQECANYYGLLDLKQAAPERLVLTPLLGREDYKDLPDPDLVILSKPDTYDGTSQVRERLRQGRYQRVGKLRAFTIWVRPGVSGVMVRDTAGPAGYSTNL